MTSHKADSRRAFLKSTVVAGAALAGNATLSNDSLATQDNTLAPGKLRVNVAGYKYDRVEALINGRVQIEGCDTEFKEARIGEMNTHVFSGPMSREVTEIGLLPFILAQANEEFRDYTLLPVFPLRVFRHKSIFIRTDRGFSKPQDLRGRKVATPGYSSTSLTWVRGILQHEYDVRKRIVYKTSLPWIGQEAEETRKLMGENYWPYGIEPNRKSLNSLIQYSHEQGLANRKLKIEELFHDSTHGLKEDPA